MSSATLAETFRSEMRDNVQPYLWSDADIVRYINEGTTALCSKAWGIRDASLYVDFISPDPVAFPPQVMKIRQAVHDETGKPYQVKSVDEDPSLWMQHPPASGATRCRSVLVGAEDGQIALVPPTPMGETIRVRFVVLRYPLVPVTSVTTAQSTEMPSEADEAIMLYMRHKAYLKADSQTYDAAKSKDMLDLWLVAADRYKHMWERRESNPRSTQRPGGGYW